MGFRQELVLAAYASARRELDGIGAGSEFIAGVAGSVDDCERNPDRPVRVVVEECWCGGRRTDIFVCDAARALEALCRRSGSPTMAAALAAASALGPSYTDPEEICRSMSEERGGAGIGSCKVVPREEAAGGACTSKGALNPLYYYYMDVAVALYAAGDTDGAARALGRAICYAQDAAFPADAPKDFVKKAAELPGGAGALSARCAAGDNDGGISGPGRIPEEAACLALRNTVSALAGFASGVREAVLETKTALLLFPLLGGIEGVAGLGFLLSGPTWAGIVLLGMSLLLIASTALAAADKRPGLRLTVRPARVVVGGARRIEWCVPAVFKEYFAGFGEGRG